MKILDKSYIAGLYDGDGSINMSRVGAKEKQGYLMKVELSQNNEEFLRKINSFFDNKGKIYEDTRHEKYTKSTNYCLRFCGKDSLDILSLIQEFGVIKSPQATLAMRCIELNKKQNTTVEKEELMSKIKNMNRNKTEYDKPYQNINNAYISGLFDAEGNVYFATNTDGKKKSYIKITQTGCPEVLNKIASYLGYGSTSELGRWRIYSKVHYLDFYNCIKDTNIMKIEKINNLLDFIRI
jgi:hypothetical protein